MKTYRITETAVYEVEAEDEGEAEAIFLDSNPDDFFIAVTDREVEEK